MILSAALIFFVHLLAGPAEATLNELSYNHVEVVTRSDGRVFISVDNALYRLGPESLDTEEMVELPGKIVGLLLLASGQSLVVCYEYSKEEVEFSAHCGVFDTDNFLSLSLNVRYCSLMLRPTASPALFHAPSGDTFYIGESIATTRADDSDGPAPTDDVDEQSTLTVLRQCSAKSDRLRYAYSFHSEEHFQTLNNEGPGPFSGFDLGRDVSSRLRRNTRRHISSGFQFGNFSYFFALDESSGHDLELRALRVCHEDMYTCDGACIMDSWIEALLNFTLNCSTVAATDNTAICDVALLPSPSSVSGPLELVAVTFCGSCSGTHIYELEAIDAAMDDMNRRCRTSSNVSIALIWAMDDVSCTGFEVITIRHSVY